MAPALFSFLLGQLDREQPASTRTAAADVLARAKLTTTQLGALADVLKIGRSARSRPPADRVRAIGG